MKFHNYIIIFAVAISGCATAHNESLLMVHNKPDEGQSICDLSRQGIMLGLTARIVATYKTDKVHYAYLSSKGCGVDGIIDVNDMEPISVESVIDFYESGDRRCNQAGTPYICVLEAKIDADVKIVRGQTREFAVEILKIHYFSFVK